MQLDLVDVFGVAPLRGNPLAVVRGGDGLSDAQMLALTRWLGFSETTFLLPPTDARADYRVRIFYPAGELPFAGHPTLGSARAWLAAGGIPRDPACLVQECGVARHLFAQGLAKGSYVAAQGRCTGADGQVDCRQEADGTVWIGGRAAMIAAGADLTLGG